MNAPTLSILVLAAGAGKRMRSARAKVLQPLAGRPLLAHVLDTAEQLEPADLVVVHGHQGEQVMAAFADRPHLRWAQQAEQLGTGHAVQQAMPEAPDDATVLVLYGDVPLLGAETLRALVAETAGHRAAALLTMDLDDPSGYGRVVRDAEGRVTAVVEDRDASPEVRAVREVNTGVFAAPARHLKRWLAALGNDNTQGEYYLTDCVAMAVAEGFTVVPVKLEDADEALGVNDRVQLAAVEAVFRRRASAQLLHQGATLADPQRVDVRGRVEVGQDVFIDVGVVLEGDVQLGDGVHVEPYSVLRNVRLGAGTRVYSHTILEDCETGRHCELGPYLRVRKGSTRLGDRVRLGNFVEVKNIEMDAGSKASHLTYLGDTTVGRGVNIGAGTIVCNYDGANKHRTVIGDDVFVGSGVELVAPLVVGDAATIGAGSTLTRDAPAGQLTIARVRQTTVSSWRRPTKKQG